MGGQFADEVIRDVPQPDPVCVATCDIVDKRKRLGGKAFERLQDVGSEDSSGSSFVPTDTAASSSSSSDARPPREQAYIPPFVMDMDDPDVSRL